MRADSDLLCFEGVQPAKMQPAAGADLGPSFPVLLVRFKGALISTYFNCLDKHACLTIPVQLMA